MRKIAVVTGSRAEYSVLKMLMNSIKKEKDLELIPLVTGMHLLSNYGNTYKIVKKDFPESVIIPMDLEGDSLYDMSKYLANGIINFSKHLKDNNPDILIVAGDRSEPLAAALSCLYLNIPIAHINGGDVSGGVIDESIRHALTKISHIHFAYTKSNAERIKKMGEEEQRIFLTGALSVEAILNKKIRSRKEIFKKYNLNENEETFLVVIHPITTLKDKGFSQFKELFLALDQLKKQTILIYPNCDSGSKNFLEYIEEIKGREYITTFKNLLYEDYIDLMNSSDIMIGNSSSGIIEAPTLKIPVINVGHRQQGRDRSDNIIDVKPTKEDILEGIKIVQENDAFREKIKNVKNKFGEGNATKKIIEILKNIEINEDLIRKQISY